LEVEPAEGRRRIQIRDFMATERLLSLWQKDSRTLADIPNGRSILLRLGSRDTRHLENKHKAAKLRRYASGRHEQWLLTRHRDKCCH